METQNKYKNGKIYMITDTNYTKCYIGSTIQRLCSRMAKHRDNFLKQRFPIRSCVLFEEFGIDGLKMELIELFPCKSREELLAREGYHIKHCDCDCVNRCLAGRSEKEWRKEHIEQKQAYDKNYNEVNKEHRARNCKIYRETHKKEISENAKQKITCACGCQIAKNTLNRHMKTEKHKALMVSAQNA